MKDRGFTMLETMMASLIGAMVVVVCVGLFGAMDRTDRGTALRFDQTSSLSRVHLVMRRTFASIVMSDASVRGSAPGRAGEKDAAPPRPRMLLESDQSPSMQRALSRMGTSGSVQRLEVVLSKAPVPAGMDSPRGEALAMAAYEPTIYAGPAVRGVFEVRPDPIGEQAKGWGVPGLDPRHRGWTLWWRPLPHQDTGLAGSLYTLDPESDPRAVPIASGLVSVKWTAFKERKRGTAFSATQFQDLPAYMELEVRTTMGLTAHWMFEVDWINGPETQEELEEREEMTQVAGAAGAAAAAHAAATQATRNQEAGMDGDVITDEDTLRAMGKDGTQGRGQKPVGLVPSRLGTERGRR
jgi:prepilin-type N-terminal cleavage/methylation domain-containing protein